MTEVQKIELAILKEYIRVCEQLDIPYYLVCGSCLGAVKYHGFIPWDDDVDVAMKREDYERFLVEAPALLPSHLFLQNYKSDKRVPFLYSKLRDGRTTLIERGTAKLPIHHGIYIDVFPLDGYPAEHAERFEKKKNRLKLKNLCAYDNDVRFATRCFILLEKALGFHKRSDRTNAKLEELLRSNSVEDSNLWCNFGNWQGELEYAPKSQYGAGTQASFEDISVRIPADYDAYLTQKYGDWRADLPPEQQKSHHNALVCDPEKPYTAYR